MANILWVIDDNKGYTESLVAMGKTSGVEIVRFQEGEKALRELKRVIDEKLPIPKAILVNYKLDDEVVNPAYLFGTEVIMEIKDICGKNEIAIPEIIGFSTLEENNKKMLEVGASSFLDKNDPNKVLEYIKNYSRIH